MPSVIPGFEYDIFISYRHNDNRSGWVTDFVNALQEELAATIKEPLSIYFDKNPHDGLLETHCVDKSLEGKLKCLIFIPIISQTYCDTKSFAWQHEFVAFNNLAKGDQFGRDIKLSNGNVASRILPVKIHDLDVEDKSIIENEIGGALRAIEFIYREPGVNRPLKSSDNKADNQSKTDYRNQVNKVALAVKEIISTITKKGTTSSWQPNPPKSKEENKKNIWVLLISISLLTLAGLAYWFFGTDKPSSGKFDKALDRAEKYMEEGERFNDSRYFKNAFQAIQKVLEQDSLNERAIYLMIIQAPGSDTAEYFNNKLLKLNPNGTYALLARAGQLAEKRRWPQAKEILMKVLQNDSKQKDALSMLAYISLIMQDYLESWKYAKQYEQVSGEILYQILSLLYLELGDFAKARQYFQLKQENKEFSCPDVEDLQKILLCEGDFEHLERVTDSLCNFSKCKDCDFWRLRAKAHVGKYNEASRWVRGSLTNMPKITWRYPAYVLLKNAKFDSARLIAKFEIDYDHTQLADTAYRQSIPLYSLAAIHAMLGNSKESLSWLRQYAANGFEMGSEWYIAHDPLFDELQKDNEFFPDFLQLFQKEQARKTAIREELRKLDSHK